MTEISVRALGPADWQTYRDVRLRALRESPDAFASTVAEEEALSEQEWQTRMERSVRIVAEQGGNMVGVASVGESATGDPGSAQVFGLWVSPALRGAGVATELVRVAASTAAQQGKTQLAYWVGSDNPRAVSFASGFGFRPGDARRKMRVHDDEDEVLMVLALGNNRGEPTLTRAY